MTPDTIFQPGDWVRLSDPSVLPVLADRLKLRPNAVGMVCYEGIGQLIVNGNPQVLYFVLFPATGLMEPLYGHEMVRFTGVPA